MRAPSVLLLDADAETCAALQALFASYAMPSVCAVSDVQSAIESAGRERSDVIVANISASLTVEAVCFAIEQSGCNIPVIALGATGSATFTLSKPFRFVDLATLVRRVVETGENAAMTGLQFGGMTFYPSRRLIVSGTGERIIVTETEVDILQYLHRLNGRVVGRKELLAEIWGYNNNVRTHTLATHIHRLRKKIEKDPARPKILLTEYHGYCLVVDQDDS